MDKPSLLIDQELICQESPREHENISLSDMEKKKNEIKHQKINEILKKTNDADVMQQFISNASRTALYVRIDDNLNNDLEKYEFREIQRAVSNVYSAGEFKEKGFIIWSYGKHIYQGRETFEKIRTWFICLLLLWALSGIVAFLSFIIILITNDYSKPCTEQDLCSFLENCFFYSIILLFFIPFIGKLAKDYKCVDCVDEDIIREFTVIRYCGENNI